MNRAPYLDADACALADREHTNTDTNTNRLRLVPARPPLSESHVIELEFAVDLLRRADKAISAELVVLRCLDVGIDWEAIQRASGTLLGMAVELHLVVAEERARRPAC